MDDTGTTTLPEALALVLLNPETGRFVVDGQRVERALAGAALLELAISGRLEDDGERHPKLRVIAVSGQDIVGDRADRLPTGWFKAKRGVTRLVPGLRSAVLDALVTSGHARRDPGGFMRLTRWQPDTALRRTLLDGIAAALRDGIATDDRTAGLVSLLYAIKAEHRVLPGRRGDLRARARMVADGDWAGPAVVAAVREVQAAAAAAVAATAATAGGGS